jgi:hypothetical protein
MQKLIWRVKRGCRKFFGVYETLRDLGQNAPVIYGACRDPECHCREIETPIQG